MRNNLIVLFFTSLIACGPSTSTTTSKKEQEIKVNAITGSESIKYEAYILASRTSASPPVEITIDSTGQMVVISQQLMQDGSWKKPKGLAKLEDKDKINLDSLVADELLYSITEEDVLPPCSDGADYIIKIARFDKSRIFSLKTNSCAIDENTLSGRQRIIFKRLIQLFESMRAKYRPQYQEKG